MENVQTAFTDVMFRGIPDAHWCQTHQLQFGDGQYRGPLVRSGMQVLLVLAARTPLPVISPFSLDEDIESLTLLRLSSG